LSHPYLEEGILRYHSCMCRCCHSVGSTRVYTKDLEPVAPLPFDSSFEKELNSVQQVKGNKKKWIIINHEAILFHVILMNFVIADKLHESILERCASSNRVPLCINPCSAAFKSFARWELLNHCYCYCLSNFDLCLFLSLSLSMNYSSTVAHPSELPPSPHCWEWLLLKN